MKKKWVPKKEEGAVPAGKDWTGGKKKKKGQ